MVDRFGSRRCLLMNVRRMRWMDRWLGVPVCFLLTCWRRFFGIRAIDDRYRPKRILFIKLSEQGSTVLAQAAIQSAVARVGRANVYFLVFAENRTILDILGLISPENIIEIRSRGLFAVIFGAVGALWRVRQAGIEAAIDLEFFARSSAALAYLSGAAWRVGYHAHTGGAPYRGDLMTHRLSFNPYLHTSQTFQIMVEALAYRSDRFPRFDFRPPEAKWDNVEFIPNAAEISEVRDLVDGLTAWNGGSGLVLLNANASDLMPLRRWPEERYVELARRLLERYPEMHVGFTGSCAEMPAVAQLVQKVDSNRCLNFAGKTTLRQLLTLCSLADVLVTNDSGPAHFASLTPVDVVVLFGPETPRLFAPRSRRTHVLWAGLACSPCINAFNNRHSVCQDNACMQAITVHEVFDRVCRIYESRRSSERNMVAKAIENSWCVREDLMHPM
jgi:ADP-heptose:LPS heptosyltransferase